jgi:myo-inositol-1(or 4)-monophosphatase
VPEPAGPDDAVPEPARPADSGVEFPDRAALEAIAVDVATKGAKLVAAGYGRANALGTKSSATDVVTQTDLDAEELIRLLLDRATPGAGILGEEGGAIRATQRLQWIIDPLDGTVNFLYALPVFAVSIAAAVDGEFVAGAVIDVLRGDVFSAHLGGGARLNGSPIGISDCTAMPAALIATGFSYTPRLRAVQGAIVRDLLPLARDIRCFGSAALQLCWVGNGRVDGYFERDIKIWDWAAGALIAAEAGATVGLPCPENDGLVMASVPAIFDALADLTAVPVPIDLTAGGSAR